jgi:DNA adenine methylase
MLADWIISHFPAHHSYLEPFFGSGAVFLQKPPSKLETLNDLDGDIVNLFRVIRDDSDNLARLIEFTPWAREELDTCYEPASNSLEQARRWLVRCWIGRSGTRGRAGWRHDVSASRNSHMPDTWKQLPFRIRNIAKRFRDAQIEHRPALEVIQRFNKPRTLIYVDPPYPLETRSGPMYRHEMSNDDHVALLEVLVNHPAMIVVSGYACALYDEALNNWYRVTTRALADNGGERQEILWINPVAADALEERSWAEGALWKTVR